MKNIEIKICGIKNKDTILVLNKVKPDYAGFIFAKSPRHVSFKEGKELIQNLDASITPVGVFVNGSNEEIEEGLKAGVHILQLHGDESLDRVNDISTYIQKKGYGNIKIWKAIPVKDSSILPLIKEYAFLETIDGILCDTYEKGSYGGTGEIFNWDILTDFHFSKPFILAGGLNKDTVEKGIRTLHPEIVDISSGVETQGEKDAFKIEEIIDVIRGK